MSGGCGSEADLDGVEVVKGAPPDGGLGRGVAAVAFVGHDQIEGVDWDGDLLGVFFVAFNALALLCRFSPEQVYRGALDGGDVDERGAGLGVHQVMVGEYAGVEFLSFAEVLALEALTV